mmetsp:Transcript_24926/g.27582  ORF Transcript_24926/g.27582 Transcript_24926/m.27582 type:complete len:209 (+) Transcript_24926:1-627(+)|eukprot:CAMPEP_0205821364 /NCGR_PEP_ID=MMETSP0206-20130828/7219_1 /ASSEMBLY_ACC=CAM_ASM_000279 /TAXON_ID=36767 /ORGANISM="Euplotes focardii, Strain TN1" /LENGTH=208 /DNA_ID=CAMNT_0053116789 /DNA_START=1 /DNA_END=627 /DNA_ORIENTATION=+
MKLTYFAFYGRAEEIRLMHHIKGVDFEDYHVEQKDWPTIKTDKERFPFGQMPTLEKDGKVYSQSVAIARLVARENGFYPTDAEEAYYVDVLTESLRDVYTGIFGLAALKTDEEKKEALEKLETTTLPINFSAWEELIKANSSQEFWHGETETVADIGLVCFYTNQILISQIKDSLQAALDKYPVLKEYLEKRQEAHKEYFEQRPSFPL